MGRVTDQTSLDITLERSPAVSQARVRATPLAIFAFACSAVGLGLLFGTGPVGIVAAPLGIISGLLAIVRPRDQGRRGLAIVAVAIGSVVTVVSLAMVLGSQAT
jgi:hypothetical protein